MPMIAVIGAGPLGGALAHVLARRNRVGDVRLIDPDGKVAEGKALDILQSAPDRTVRDPCERSGHLCRRGRR